MDAHKNFAYSTLLSTPTSLGGSQIAFTIQAGDQVKFPSAPFNVTVWPSGVLPTSSNAEILRVTSMSSNSLTATRAQEGTTQQAGLAANYQIALTITVKTITDIETPVLALSTFQTSLTATAPINYNNSTFVFSMTAADATHDGYLTKTDWARFNVAASGSTVHTIKKFSGNFTYQVTAADQNTIFVADSVVSSGTWNMPDSKTVQGYSFSFVVMGSTAFVSPNIAMFGSDYAFSAFYNTSNGGNVSLTPRTGIVTLVAVASGAWCVTGELDNVSFT